MVNLSTVEDIRKIIKKEGYAPVKYVKVNGTYRFCLFDWNGPNHSNMITDGEVVESAAYLNIDKDTVEVHSNSMTLRKGPALDDKENITS